MTDEDAMEEGVELEESPPQPTRNGAPNNNSIDEGCASVPETETTVDAASEKQRRRPLTCREMLNLSACLLAWACTISNVTLVVGTSGVVVLSIGGGNSITSIPLAAFVLGASGVSAVLTNYLFQRAGRKVGFLVGIAFGLIGTALGVVSIFVKSPGLNIVASAFFGAHTGIGFFLRFAALELVPPHWSARAMTLVVSGGVIAAFAGPESAHATVGMFNDDNDPDKDHLEYLGVYMMTGIFNVANVLFTLVVIFPDTRKKQESLQSSGTDSGAKTETKTESKFGKMLCMYKDLTEMRAFLVPMLIAGLSWSIMALPMSLLRVAMKETGFTSTQSLRVIELHFCGMYAPGFVTGKLISRFGPQAICGVGAVLYAITFAFNLSSKTEEEGSVAVWYLGLIFVGIGWNFGFTGATMWTTRLFSKEDFSYSKNQVQSANDCLMFLFAGAWIFSAGYIYDAGGAELDGWKVLNWTAVGLLGVYVLIALIDCFMEKNQTVQEAKTEGASILVKSETLTTGNLDEESNRLELNVDSEGSN
jgi:MFS family permease